MVAQKDVARIEEHALPLRWLLFLSRNFSRVLMYNFRCIIVMTDIEEDCTTTSAESSTATSYASGSNRCFAFSTHAIFSDSVHKSGWRCSCSSASSCDQISISMSDNQTNFPKLLSEDYCSIAFRISCKTSRNVMNQ